MGSSIVLVGKNFKVTIINIFKEIKELCLKKSMTATQQIENISKERDI